MKMRMTCIIKRSGVTAVYAMGVARRCCLEDEGSLGREAPRQIQPLPGPAYTTNSKTKQLGG